MDKNSLKHYGVLGMKWGRRKATDNGNASGRKNTSKTTSGLISEIRLGLQISKKKRDLERNDERRYNEEADKIEKAWGAKVKEINSEVNADKSIGFGRKWVEKFKRRVKFANSEEARKLFDADAKAFDRMANAPKIRRDKVIAAQERVYKEYEAEGARLYNEKVVNTPFPKNILNALNYDVKLNQDFEVKYLQAELDVYESEE